jgi:deoxyribonuclease-4
MNIGTNDKRKSHISMSILNNEVNRTSAIKARYLIIHPGNATDTTKEQAIKNIASSINSINKKNNDVCICLETMSGKGNEIGSTFNEIKQIIDLIENKHLIGVCLDTCHINDAGYDVAKVDDILNEFEKVIGLKYLKVIHLNDSKNIKGAKKDRHENIGYGTIGFNNFIK